MKYLAFKYSAFKLKHYLFVKGYVNGRPYDKSRKIRIAIMRYCNLAWILLMRNISDQIAIRFRQDQDDDELEETSLRDMFFNFNKDRSE